MTRRVFLIEKHPNIKYCTINLAAALILATYQTVICHRKGVEKKFMENVCGKPQTLLNWATILLIRRTWNLSSAVCYMKRIVLKASRLRTAPWNPSWYSKAERDFSDSFSVMLRASWRTYATGNPSPHVSDFKNHCTLFFFSPAWCYMYTKDSSRIILVLVAPLREWFTVYQSTNHFVLFLFYLLWNKM